MSQFLSIHLHLLWKTIFHYQCFQYKHRYLFLSTLKLFFIRRFYNYPEIQRIEPSGVKEGTYLGCKCNSSDPHPQSLKMLFLSDSQFHKSRDVPLSLWGICLHSDGRICINRTGWTNFLETLFQSWFLKSGSLFCNQLSLNAFIFPVFTCWNHLIAKAMRTDTKHCPEESFCCE